MTDDIVFIGGGGHALSLLESLPWDLRYAGYISLEMMERMPGAWLGDDSAAAALAEKGYLFHVAFVYNDAPVMDKRRELICRYESLGVKFASVVARSAIVTPNSRIGDGAAVLAGAIVNRASLGRHVVVNSGAIVEHDCSIGCNSFVGPGAVLGGNVCIGEDCFIGLGAKIRNGISIAPGVTVAMGAVVTRDITEPGIYHGSPLHKHTLD